MDVEKLRTKPNITRQDISDLLHSIGKPGENRDEKTETVKKLNRMNTQGIDLADSLNSYSEW